VGRGSRGLKAGLAAGAVYGLMVGLLHFGQLQICRSYQIPIIYQALLLQNASATLSDAQKGFAETSIYLPVLFGSIALVVGVIYGGVFGYAYYKIPFSTSRTKGTLFGVAIFLLGIWPLGLSGTEINCAANYYLIPLTISFPASLATGYLMGVFYDAPSRSSSPYGI
jgi:hypothetical protein